MAYRLFFLSVRHIVRLLLVGLLLVLSASLLFAQDVGEQVVKRGTVDDDVYLAGGNVELLATVKGDVVVAGGQLQLDGPIGGDLIAAGGSVTLRSPVADDVRLVGGNVQLLGTVGDDLIAAGGYLRMGATTRVDGRAWLAGGYIHVDGVIRQGLRVGGGRVTIDGTVQGDVEVWAKQIEVGPTAVISGRLLTHGPNKPQIAKGARIEGEQDHNMVEVPSATVMAVATGAGILVLLSMIVTGVVLYLVFPGTAERSTRSLRDAPWLCLGLGLAVFAATPVLVLVLLITGVGLWLALLLLAAYLMLLLLGYLTGALFVGETGLRLLGKTSPGKAWTAAALAAAVLLLAIVGLIPLLGGLLYWLLILAGMGTLTRQMFAAYSD